MNTELYTVKSGLNTDPDYLGFYESKYYYECILDQMKDITDGVIKVDLALNDGSLPTTVEGIFENNELVSASLLGEEWPVCRNEFIDLIEMSSSTISKIIIEDSKYKTTIEIKG